MWAMQVVAPPDRVRARWTKEARPRKLLRPSSFLLEMDGQQSDISRCNPAYSSRLTKGRRPHIGEFLPSLYTKAADMSVVDGVRDRGGFRPLGAHDRIFLAFDIAFLFQ